MFGKMAFVISSNIMLTYVLNEYCYNFIRKLIPTTFATEEEEGIVDCWSKVLLT